MVNILGQAEHNTLQRREHIEDSDSRGIDDARRQRRLHHQASFPATREINVSVMSLRERNVESSPATLGASTLHIFF